MLLTGIIALTSCEKDMDSNPTLVQPATFVLNNPAVGSGNVDLAKSAGIDLTWSQPQYTDKNAPVVVTYTIQVSSSNSFTKAFDATQEDNTGADYFIIDETTTTCNATVSTASIAKGLQQINAWEENAVPESVTLSIRVAAAVKNAISTEFCPILSNTVSVTALPMYVELRDADPNWWHLIGGDIADGKWGDFVPTSLFPMQPKKDYDFDKKTGDGELMWTGYLAGNGFKLKQIPGNWDNQWGGSLGNFVENDGGSSDIKVDPGFYTVTLNTGKHQLSVEPYDGNPDLYETICIVGSFDGWGAGKAMDPVFVFDGAVNHDWYTTITLAAGEEIKFNIGNWDANWGSVPTRFLSDGLYGYGTHNGDNIVVKEGGNYQVIFNDITGYYRLIKQ